MSYLLVRVIYLPKICHLDTLADPEAWIIDRVCYPPTPTLDSST